MTNSDRRIATIAKVLHETRVAVSVIAALVIEQRTGEPFPEITDEDRMRFYEELANFIEQVGQDSERLKQLASKSNGHDT